MNDCKHERFLTSSKVFRLKESDESEEITGYSADIKIHCTECGQAFEFIGVPMGHSPIQPMVNADCTELRIPIRPSTLPPLKNENKIVN
jgi:hypothetical protein